MPMHKYKKQKNEIREWSENGVKLPRVPATPEDDVIGSAKSS